MKDIALKAVVKALPKVGIRLFSAKHDFSSEWYSFFFSTSSEKKQVLKLNLSQKRFPLQFGDKGQITAMSLFLVLQEGLKDNQGKSITYKDSDPLRFALKLKKEGTNEFSADFKNKALILSNSPFKGLPYVEPFKEQEYSPGEWVFEVQEASEAGYLRHTVTIGGEDRLRLNPEAIEDIWFLCHYSVQ